MHEENKKQELGKTWWKSCQCQCQGIFLSPQQPDCAMWSLCSRPCFRTPRGNPAHHRVTITSPQQSTQSNQTGKIRPVMTPLWVVAGLRRIWWFLLNNFRTVSHWQLYLQLDMSGNPTSSHVSPFQRRTRFFHITMSLFKLSLPRYYRCAGWNNWMEHFQMHGLNTSS